MKIGIGLGRGPDAAKAAAGALRAAKKNVSKPDLALVFGSIHLDQKKIHQTACREIDSDILMGGSSYAEIAGGEVVKNGVAALLLDLDGAKISFSQVKAAADPYETGLALARGLPARSDRQGTLPLALVLASVASGHENETLRGFDQGAGPLPIFGGICSGNYDLGMTHPDFWKFRQYCGRSLTSQTVRAALIDLPVGEYKTSFGFEHGWKPVGPAVELTRCRGNKVFEVGGVPVFDYYRQFLGDGHNDKFFELMIQRYGFSVLLDEKAGLSQVRLPVLCDFKERSIAYFPADDLQGRQARLILASRKGLVDGAKEAAARCLKGLDGAEPALVLMVSCCTRNLILHSRIETELAAVREVFGPNVPIFGYYSGGEFAPFLSRYQEIVDRGRTLCGSHYHTTTVCLLAIASKSAVKSTLPKRRAPAKPPKPGSEAARLREMLAIGEDTLDNSERFLANLSRKSYLDGERLKKQNEIIHRYTPHNVFDEIGANVDRGQDELSDAEFNGCFLFMDVKGFTSFSEEHSSKEVVAALNAIFEPATETIYACGGDVDKFIGDCIFAAFPEGDGALEAGRRILEMMAKMKDSPFSVRIGVNAGRAVRANVGAKARREYTYIGDAVNLAQRLESNCTPGRMLVAEDVLKNSQLQFPSAELKEILVKGKKKPVRAYECAP